VSTESKARRWTPPLAISVIIALAGSYLLGYVGVRHTFTSGAISVEGIVYARVPAPLTYFSPAASGSRSRTIRYYLFYPLVMADCSWNSRGYVDPDGRIVPPRDRSYKTGDWIPVGPDE
jgi:hypothetical protein